MVLARARRRHPTNQHFALQKNSVYFSLTRINTNHNHTALTHHVRLELRFVVNRMALLKTLA
ncbi:hypothetical protein Pmani_016754, partial [Petrolisthes manimaculis]